MFTKESLLQEALQMYRDREMTLTEYLNMKSLIETCLSEYDVEC